MTTTTIPTFEVYVPYEQKKLNPEIKRRGGHWNPDSRKWILPDSKDNRAFASNIKPMPPTHLEADDRVAAIGANAAALLNSLQLGVFTVQFANATVGITITKKD